MATISMAERDSPKMAYSTTTKSAAKILGQMVAKQDSSDSSALSKSSSHSTIHLSRMERRTANPDQPLPPLPRDAQPIQVPPPRVSTHIHVEDPIPHVFASSDQTASSQEDYFKSKTPLQKSKHSSTSLPRRILEELNEQRTHHRHSNTTSETNPNDSHGGRHRYSHSRSSNSRSTSASSIAAILTSTAERLARETARANEAERRAIDAERQASDLMALFKSTHEAKLQLERELQRAREELGLYKIQLDVAQKEIFRAQEIVDRVERQRVNAEDEVTRTTERMRKLSQTLAVEHALEEGRRSGFEDGLKQGRVYQEAQTAMWSKMYEKPKKASSRRQDDQESVSSYSYSRSSSNSGSSTSELKSRPRPHQPSSNVPQKQIPTESAPSASSYPRADSELTPSIYPQVSTYNPLPRGNLPAPRPPTHLRGAPPPPDVATYPATLPVPTITTPTEVGVPSTQPPVPEPMPPHHPPERIKIKPSDEPIHPLPIRNRSQSVGHESIVVPPEGYVPVMGANSIISLPPPHELSQPVSAEAPPLSATSKPRPSTGGGESRFYVTNNQRSPPRYKDAHNTESVAYTTRNGRDDPRFGVSTSARSYASTQISELDMLNPPRKISSDPDRDRPRSRSSEPDTPTATVPQSRPRAFTQSNGYPTTANKWNNDVQPLTTPVATEPYKPRSQTPKQSAGRSGNDTTSATAPVLLEPYPRPRNQTPKQSAIRPESRSQKERPGTGTTTPAGYPPPRPPSSAARRAREVVLPLPLGDPFDDPTTAHGHSSYPHRSATPGPPAYGRPRFDEATSQSNSPSKDKRSSNATLGEYEIAVETPTTTHMSITSNLTSVVNPVFLTPESANRPVPLPDYGQTYHQAERPDLRITTNGQGDSKMQLSVPESNPPSAFPPLSPISGMDNLTSYPPGFAPSIPRNHPSGGMSTFTYSSPLVRPVA